MSQCSCAYRFSAVFGILAVAQFVTSCDGSSLSPGSAALIDKEGPEVKSSSPDAGDRRVSLASDIEVTFVGNVLNTSVGTGEFSVSDATGSTVPGHVVFDAVDNVATFYPEAGLLPASRYRVELSSGIVDLEGNALEPYNWAFETAGDVWATGSELESNAGSTGQHQLAVDAAGNAFGLWMQHDGTRYNLWASASVAEPDGGAGPWSAAELFEHEDGSAAYPRVALAANGRAIALWRQSSGSEQNLLSSYRSTSAEGVVSWGAPELLESTAALPTAPQLVVDGSGNALAVWVQFDGTSNSVWSNRFTATPGNGGSWAGAEVIEAEASASSYPELSMDAEGHAVAVWLQADGANKSVWSNRWVLAPDGTGSWGVAASIDNSTAQASKPRIDMDVDGNAVVVWVQSDGVSESIWSNRFTAAQGGSWEVAEVLESSDETAAKPHIALGAEGRAVAVWEQADGTGVSVFARRYARSANGSAGWGEVIALESGSEEADDPQVSLDERGNALVVWAQSDGSTDRVWSSRYAMAGAVEESWGQAELAESNVGGYGHQPKIGMDAAGNAHLLWQMYGGSDYDIWASRFIAHLP